MESSGFIYLSWGYFSWDVIGCAPFYRMAVSELGMAATILEMSEDF
jgi:hypothetical protein